MVKLLVSISNTFLKTTTILQGFSRLISVVCHGASLHAEPTNSVYSPLFTTSQLIFPAVAARRKVMPTPQANEVMRKAPVICLRTYIQFRDRFSLSHLFHLSGTFEARFNCQRPVLV